MEEGGPVTSWEMSLWPSAVRGSEWGNGLTRESCLMLLAAAESRPSSNSQASRSDCSRDRTSATNLSLSSILRLADFYACANLVSAELAVPLPMREFQAKFASEGRKEGGRSSRHGGVSAFSIIHDLVSGFAGEWVQGRHR